MAVYLINILILLILATILYKIKFKDRNKVICIVIGIQLFALSAFRANSVGIDVREYIHRFLIISKLPWDFLYENNKLLCFEYGYTVFNKLISIISDDERILLLITSAVIIIGISKYFYENSKLPWLSFYLFITLGHFSNSMNLVRQYIAIIIIVNSIKYIQKRQLFNFLISLIVAINFHTSALIFFILYPLSKIKINRIYLSLIICGIIFIKMFSIKIITTILNMSSYIGFSDLVGEGNGWSTLLLLLVVIFLTFIYKNSFKKVNENAYLYYHILLISLVFNVLAFDFVHFGRAMLYYTINLTIIIPNLVHCISSQIMKNAIIIGTCIVTFIYYIYLSGIDANGVVPYLFMWQ